jgi:hypothetical protein
MNVEHCDYLSWFLRKRESHQQDGEALLMQQHGCESFQRPAILPWPSDFLDMDGQRPVALIGRVAAGHVSGRRMRSAT